MLNALSCYCPPPSNWVAPEDIDENGSSQSFQVTIDKNGDCLGAVIDFWPSRAQVVSIEMGKIMEYNSTAPAGRKVRRNDFITQVNGISGNAGDMLNEIQTMRILKMTFVHPDRRLINVSRSGGAWGLMLDFKATTACPMITNIADGAFKAFNETLEPEEQVKINDFIESINGIERNASEMAQELKLAHSAQFVILKLPKLPECNESS